MSLVGCNTSEKVSVQQFVDGQGLILPSNQIVQCASNARLEFTYVPGETGISEGGAILFIVSPFWNWSVPQTTNPENSGYVSVEHSRKHDLILEAESAGQNCIRVNVIKGELNHKDWVKFVYGAGNAKARTDSFADRDQPFYFKTDSDGNGSFQAISDQPAVRVTAQAPAELLITLPSQIETGKWFELKSAVVDRFGNWVSDYNCDLELIVPEHFEIESAASIVNGHSVVSGKASEPGLYRVTGFVKVLGIKAVSNPVLVKNSFSLPNIYWGDLHGHTNLSDGTGSISDYYDYARWVSGCDFAAATDHDMWGFDSLQANLSEYSEAMLKAAEANKFVTFFGYEWTNWTFGHRNVYLKSPLQQIYDCTQPLYDSPQKLDAALENKDAMIIPHHLGGGPIAFDLETGDSPFISVAEVLSVHGVSESYGSNRRIYNSTEGAFYRDSLKAGRFWGAIASSDCHDGHPGYRSSGRSVRGICAVYASNLTQDDLFRSIKERRCYGTSGARIILDFSVSGYPMGSIIEQSPNENPKVAISIIGESDLERIVLVKNGNPYKVFYGNENIASIDWEDPVKIPNNLTYYYVVVNQMDGEIAVSSPIWFNSKTRTFNSCTQ